jgi:porphobilinogen synthase
VNYIECLFIGPADRPKESALKNNLIHSVDSALAHVELRLEQGLSRWLVVAVNQQKGLSQVSDPHFHIVRFIERACQRWTRDQITLIADVGLSPYLESGQSVIFADNGIDIEASYQGAVDLALCFAKAGADYVAPCLSLPDQTSRLVSALAQNGLECGLMPYSTKFSSSLYGPYRNTVQSSLGLKRKDYQFDFSDAEQALQQMDSDLKQGAAMTIVKPALPYLDVLQDACRRSLKPVAVYHVSGEYAMAIHASEVGLLYLPDYFEEVHAAFHRCGAQYVIGYAADFFLESRNQ